MSQMTSSARVGARAMRRPITATPRLRVVAGAPLRRGGAALAILCATVLTIGLIGVLLLNTVLAQGSFTLHDLRTTSDQLTDTQGALSQSLETSQSPASLAKRAAAMGLVPAQSAAFLRLSDGKVIGVVQQASRAPGLTVAGANARPGPAAAKAAKPAKTAHAVAAAPKPSKR